MLQVLGPETENIISVHVQFKIFADLYPSSANYALLLVNLQSLFEFVVLDAG